jgi:uncharacterized protein (DUF302 family)
VLLMIIGADNESPGGARQAASFGPQTSEEAKSMNTQASCNGKPAFPYGYGRTLDVPFGEALERARAALASEGFGVLCEIDLKEKLRQKLGVDFRNYVILGACNPPLAYQILQRELNIGLLLPCNVVVYEDSGRTVVAAIDAVRMISVVGNREIESMAGLVNEKLQRVINSL